MNLASIGFALLAGICASIALPDIGPLRAAALMGSMAAVVLSFGANR